MERKDKIIGFLLDNSNDVEKRIDIVNEINSKFPDSDQFEIIPKLKKRLEEDGEVPSLSYFIENYDYTWSIDTSDESSLSFSETRDLIELEYKDHLNNDLVSKLSDYVSREDRSRDLDEFIPKLRAVIDNYDRESGKKRLRTLEEIIAERERQHRGLRTGIEPLDERIDALQLGTMSTLAGYTGQFKSTIAEHIMYQNIVKYGYNIVFISLEMPREKILFSLLSQHTVDSDIEPIPANDIRNVDISDDVKNTLLNKTWPKLKNNDEYGNFEVLDSEHFDSFTLSGMQSRLNQLSFEVDCVIIDYVQLLKYRNHPFQLQDDPIDHYVRYLSKLEKDVDGHGKKAHIMLLSQVNRSGYEEAKENDGRYDNRAISEAHNIERNSSFIFFTFAPSELRQGGETKIILTKNRDGQTMTEPAIVQIDPALSRVGQNVDLKEEQKAVGFDEVESLLDG